MSSSSEEEDRKISLTSRSQKQQIRSFEVNNVKSHQRFSCSPPDFKSGKGCRESSDSTDSDSSHEEDVFAKVGEVVSHLHASPHKGNEVKNESLFGKKSLSSSSRIKLPDTTALDSNKLSDSVFPLNDKYAQLKTSSSPFRLKEDQSLQTFTSAKSGKHSNLTKPVTAQQKQNDSVSRNQKLISVKVSSKAVGPSKLVQKKDVKPAKLNNNDNDFRKEHDLSLKPYLSSAKTNTHKDHLTSPRAFQKENVNHSKQDEKLTLGHFISSDKENNSSTASASVKYKYPSKQDLFGTTAVSGTQAVKPKPEPRQHNINLKKPEVPSASGFTQSAVTAMMSVSSDGDDDDDDDTNLDIPFQNISQLVPPRKTRPTGRSGAERYCIEESRREVNKSPMCSHRHHVRVLQEEYAYQSQANQSHNANLPSANLRQNQPVPRNIARPDIPPIRNHRQDQAPGNGRDRREHDREHGNNAQQNRPRYRPAEINFSFRRLKELEFSQPAETLSALSYSKEGLKRLLQNEEKLKNDKAMTCLLLNSLAKVTVCQSMPAQLIEVLNLVRCSSFLKSLRHFLTQSVNYGSPRETSKIFMDILDLLKVLLMRFPDCLDDVILLHAFLSIAIKQSGHDSEEKVTAKLKDLEIIKDGALQSLQQKQNIDRGQVIDEDTMTPPTDFRDISVFPTTEDVEKDERPFLRKNKQKGGYLNLDHYLDVQFRLLREDFVYPLRDGISQYLKLISGGPGHHGPRLKDVRVYHNVHILRPVCLQSGLGHRLSFDVSGNLKRIRWEVSKRLIFGSLLCLSADNFQTLYFATVSNRDPKDLKEGVIDVVFEHTIDEIAAISSQTSFTMAETTTFFEAYRHVLLGLKNIREGTLPFERYIIRCEKEVHKPAYITQDIEQCYDLRPLVDDDIELREDRNLLDQRRDVAYSFSQKSSPAEKVQIMRREEWPDPKLLNLDRSQFSALHCALTKEFCVIQGPPGTGKTYVGLKIVKALLHNRKCWDPALSSPMLIVCYTNHALDQFMEGILSFFKGVIIRVGNRSKSEALEQHTLSNMRYKMRQARGDALDRDYREVSRLRFQGRDEMDQMKKMIDIYGLKIEVAKREIPHEDVLQAFMLPRHYDRLKDAEPDLQYQYQQEWQTGKGRTKKQIFCIPEWLGLGAFLQDARVTAENLQNIEEDLGEEEELDIEGEVQALEQQNRLDIEDVPEPGKKKRQEEKKAMILEERKNMIGIDISLLDRARNFQPAEGGFQIPKDQLNKIKRKLRRKLELIDHMTEEEEKQVEDIWLLEINERWRLFRRWTHLWCEHLSDEMRGLERLYDQQARRHQETLMQEDKYIFKKASVIAMTTTAAARYQSVLQEIKPKIIVVEEAAEVLEGHVITTLSGDCEHLILIGDHKQLRPSANVYKLAKKYNLELSLFERMINNELRCDTLGWQHRMRPEIAELVKPIYPDLENHSSVLNYENIKGISSNVYFINHCNPEAHDLETKSRSNLYEAQYLVKLCSYLLKQGYSPYRITVLTTYSGQLFQLKKLMPKKTFDGVRVTVVDNFQGEENDIILLSLVRSNEENNIGFLKTDNRICVALSRAKMGLYVIGNFDLLRGESDLWEKILTSLEKKNCLGDSLALYCQNHPRDQGLIIRKPEDFDRSPEGGCMKACTTRLDCGHVCTLLCHPYDQEHKNYHCIKPCERIMNCEFKHKCRKSCFEKCGDCREMVARVLPACGHMQYMQCCVKVREFSCQAKCDVILPCGHPCGDKCGEPHKCFEKVPHTWTCGHRNEIWCKDRDTASCPANCEQQLLCEHRCSGKCGSCHYGLLHQTCKNKCTRILVCGHACQDTCSNCPPCMLKCENSCIHSSCKKWCGDLCVPCREPCVWRCPHYQCTRLCSEPCNRPRCDQPCPLLLKCDHPCIGLCGEPCPTLCRICDKAKVTEILFGTEEDDDARFVQLECEHVIEVSGLDHWMEIKTSEHEDSIQLKVCPKCKTPIRRNLRYGSIISQRLQDIEAIKRRILGDEKQMKEIMHDLEKETRRKERPNRLNRLGRFEELLEEHSPNYTHYRNLKAQILEAGEKSNLGGLICMKNQMNLLDETRKLIEIMGSKYISNNGLSMAVKQFEKWIILPRQVFRDQESSDAKREIQRLQDWLHLLRFTTLAVRRLTKLPTDVLDLIAEAKHCFEKGLVYTDSKQEAVKELFVKLQKLIPDSELGISNEERIMILEAMQLTKGHWYKCKNGHVYAIGDCGGANQVSQCPECRSEIGGENHRLREGNAVATEMDGATEAAWPP